MTKTVLLVMLGVVGCGGSVDHINYWADSTIPAEDAAAACAAWTNGVGVECKAVDSGAANVLITAFYDASDTAGRTAPWKQPITIKVNLAYTADLAASIAHEMGHAIMGPQHLDTGPALMNTTTDFYDQPALTKVDIAGYRALYPSH